MSRIGVAPIEMPRIMQNKSHGTVHNIIYRVSHAEKRTGAMSISCTPVRKHIFDKTISADMQSVLSRQRQHAISYVLAGGSMDRADRAQGIRLIARMFARSFSFSSYLFSISWHVFSLPLFLSFIIILFLFLRKRESFFTAETIFNSDEKLRIVLSLLRSHECIAHRITADAIRNCHGEFAASLALNMRRRAAVTSQSELQTKRVSAFQPNHSRRIFPGGSFSFRSLRCRMLI